MEDKLSTEPGNQDVLAQSAQTLSLFSLQDRVAVVTGAGSGIGQRISLGFAGCGAAVVLVDINEAGLDETAKMLTATVGSGKAALPVKCDVGREDEVLALFDQVRAHFGQVD